MVIVTQCDESKVDSIFNGFRKIPLNVSRLDEFYGACNKKLEESAFIFCKYKITAVNVMEVFFSEREDKP